jgi:hypothetical protein
MDFVAMFLVVGVAAWLHSRVKELDDANKRLASLLDSYRLDDRLAGLRAPPYEADLSVGKLLHVDKLEPLLFGMTDLDVTKRIAEMRPSDPFDSSGNIGHGVSTRDWLGLGGEWAVYLTISNGRLREVVVSEGISREAQGRHGIRANLEAALRKAWGTPIEVSAVQPDLRSLMGPETIRWWLEYATCALEMTLKGTDEHIFVTARYVALARLGLRQYLSLTTPPSPRPADGGYPPPGVT